MLLIAFQWGIVILAVMVVLFAVNGTHIVIERDENGRVSSVSLVIG